MKQLIFLVLIFAFNYSFAQDGSISGRVYSALTKETIPFSKIIVYKDNKAINKTKCDSAGNFRITNLKPDTFTVICKSKSYPERHVTGVIVQNNKTSVVYFDLKKEEKGREYYKIGKPTKDAFIR